MKKHEQGIQYDSLKGTQEHLNIRIQRDETSDNLKMVRRLRIKAQMSELSCCKNHTQMKSFLMKLIH